MGYLGADYFPHSVFRGLSADDRRYVEADEADYAPLMPRFKLLRAIVLRDLPAYTKAEQREVVEYLAGGLVALVKKERLAPTLRFECWP